MTVREVILAFAAAVGTLPCFATTYQVSDAYGVETNDGITAPVKSITNALAKATAAGDEIVISNGTYAISATIEIARDLTIRGRTGNPEDVVIEPSGSFIPGFQLSHAKARVSSLVVTGFKGGAHWYAGAGIRIAQNSSGTVSNCVIRNCHHTTGAAYAYGGGAIGIMSGSSGLVTHCVISNCFDDMSFGTAIRMMSGTVRNCLIVRNDQLGKATLGTVNISGGTLESCTIADNFAGIGCAGVLASGGTVRNCLIARNATQAETPAYAVWAGSAARFAACVSDVAAINENCYLTTADPFASAETDDWRPAPGSVPVDRAAEQTWMTGATDLEGNDRIRGDKPDVGCYERDPTTFAATFRSSSGTQCYTNSAVVFTVSAAPVGASGISCEWDWNGDGTYDETVVGATATHRFAAVGSYRVSVRVTDVASGTKALTQSVTYTVLPKTLFVSTAGSATQPYATPETAANDLQTAYDAAVAGQEIVLMPDTYTYTAAFTIDKAVTVRGSTGKPEDVIIKSDGNAHRLFVIKHHDAVLASMVIQDVVSSGVQSLQIGAAGVYVTGDGGTVSNCVIRNCNLQSSFSWGGGGVGMDSVCAHLTHTIISNCCDKSPAYWGNGDPAGGALRMKAGTARNCLFVKNRFKVETTDYKAYGTVRIEGGTMANCTLAGNYAGVRCSGVYATGGTVVNCLIAGNDTDDTTPTNSVWYGTASCFTNCISDVAPINAWCLYCASPYAAADYGDYRPAPGSAPVNAAATLGWMAGATDLEGNDRIRGAAPDVGCYEIDPNAFSATLTFSSGSYGFANEPLTVTVATPAVGEEGIKCEWDWDGDGTYEETTYGTVATHTYTARGNYTVRARVTDIGGERTCTTSDYAFTVHPRVIYVSNTGSATPPYATRETAANDLQTAYDSAIAGQEIAFVADTYTFASAVTIAKGVTVRSETWKPEDVIIKSDGACHRIFVLSQRDALLTGLTVTDGTDNEYVGRGGIGVYLNLDGGTVSNCVIRNCQSQRSCYHSGGCGVSLDASYALVTHCIISNCADLTFQDGNGGAARIWNGCMRNCLIVKNREGSSSKTYGAVRIDGGSLENCTIAGNAGGSQCAGVWALGGKVYNCLIAGNTTTSTDHPEYAVWAGTASCFDHCVSDVAAINENCAVTERAFKHPERGDYHSAQVSPAVNGGLLRPWMDGATDLDGKPRIQGPRPDVGCYERDRCGFSIVIR